MWIKTITGDAVNMNFAFEVEWIEYDNSPGNFDVVVWVDSNNYKTIATFGNKDDAKKCIEEIVHALNGDEKVGYSFSWLNKSTPAETEKPVDNNPALIDGIAL